VHQSYREKADRLRTVV